MKHIKKEAENGKRVLFISSNSKWGGSEILWALTANLLTESGHKVAIGTYYPYEQIKHIVRESSMHYSLLPETEKTNLLNRILVKLRLTAPPFPDPLSALLDTQKPQLVIISQGNNIDGLPFMNACIQRKIPFVTLTHLVSEYFWPFLTDEKINELNLSFDKAEINFFVSNSSLAMHNKLLCTNIRNAAIAINPFVKSKETVLPYPPLSEGRYKIALVGRIELYHKGYDLLLDVIKQQKWQKRNVWFSIYGSGPHRELLSRMINTYGISNISLNEHIDDISKIWETHHILLMPSRMEGQSLALIEALHYQRAAIVTAVGGTEEIVEEGVNGFVSQNPTLPEIDAALERAWNSRNNWEEMGKRSRELILKKHPVDAVHSFSEQIMKAIIH